MASLLVRRAPSTIGVAFSLFKCSARHLRGFCTAASTESSSTAGDGGVEKPKRKKKKNVFEVACFLPNWGISYHMAKTHWNNVSYEITKLNLYKDGKHGKAWGIAHKDGAPVADAPKKISGVHKRCWRYIPDSKKPAPREGSQNCLTKWICSYSPAYSSPSELKFY